MMKEQPKFLEGFLEGLPEQPRQRFLAVRQSILSASPDWEEELSFGVPTFKLGGLPTISLGVFGKYIGIFATIRNSPNLKAKVASMCHKGSIRLRHDAELPLPMVEDLARQIVQAEGDASQD